MPVSCRCYEDQIQRLGASGRRRIQHEGARCQLPERSYQLGGLRFPRPGRAQCHRQREWQVYGRASGQALFIELLERGREAKGPVVHARRPRRVVALVEPEEVGEEHHDILGAAREDLSEHRVGEQPRVEEDCGPGRVWQTERTAEVLGPLGALLGRHPLYDGPDRGGVVGPQHHPIR
jgi:hypothetical protein